MSENTTSNSDKPKVAKVEITEEIEQALDVLFKDARTSAKDFNRSLHRGRLLDEIDDDIEAVRAMLGIEL